MFVGTGSDVGKSIINTAFCRIFKQDGYRPAPFKAQNMSLNSYATPDGLEIGRAQAVQAEACGIDCRVEMNPVLLKPTGDTLSQMVLHGKPIGNQSAWEYFMHTDRDWLFNEAMQSCAKLQKQYNPIVIEGAGSISEINLWDKDITNMRVAVATDAATYLVADIDRGGVFASVYGSIQLLSPEQHRLIKGIIINKFRGDEALFYDGRRILEQLTGKPVVGIIPYLNQLNIDQEDSVVLDTKPQRAEPGKHNIAVVWLKHLSNFTDFALLEQIPGVHLYYATSVAELQKADVVMIPGTKNTLADLVQLKTNGMAKSLIEMHQNGVPVYGICGGYQLMGKSIEDPHGVEGEITYMEGLGLLPVKTVLQTKKQTSPCSFRFLNHPEIGSGYEIHMGITEPIDTHSPLCTLTNGKTDGYYLNAKTWGTYLHGMFDNPFIVESILQQINPNFKMPIGSSLSKEANYNRLADEVRMRVDLPYIYQTLQYD